MPPSPSSPRLRDLLPADVAKIVVDLVREHVARLTFTLAPGCQWVETGTEPLSSTLAWTVIQLTAFAQSGARGDWADDGMVVDGIQEVCSALYSRAGEPMTFGIGALDEALDDVDLDAIGLVLVGAHARVKLGQRAGRVSAREVAVLAGTDAQHVRLLARKGELTLEDGEIARAEARRWLGARGIAT